MAWQVDVVGSSVTSDHMVFTGNNIDDVFMGCYVGRSNPGNTLNSAAIIASKTVPPDNRFLVEVNAPANSILNYAIFSEV
jgi:hypothetical protein